MATAGTQELSLLLIGKTGAGKSTTGNNIIGFEKFEEGDDGVSMTTHIQDGWSKFSGFDLHVFDGPGLFDTRVTEEESGKHAEELCRQMAYVIDNCPNGLNALILVMKYGDRFTEENQSAIHMYRQIFGENALKEIGILLFTHGDMFYNKQKRKLGNHKSFEEYCRTQEGELKKLIDEFENRCVLFTNYDDEKRQEQLQKLVEIITSFKGAYKNKHFDEAERSRNSFLVKANEPLLNKELQKEIDILLKEIDEFRNTPIGTKGEEVIARLKDIKLLALDLEKKVKDDDKDTGVLENLFKDVKVSKTV